LTGSIKFVPPKDADSDFNFITRITVTERNALGHAT